MKYQNIREEELKNKVANDYFWLYDFTKIIGNVDFYVSMHQSTPSVPRKERLNPPQKNEHDPTKHPRALVFSPKATVVLDAGRDLWRYYHRQPGCNVNASLYDITEHFERRNEKGKMNNKSLGETYMNLLGDLREKLRQLAEKMEIMVYEYEFLKQ